MNLAMATDRAEVVQIFEGPSRQFTQITDGPKAIRDEETRKSHEAGFVDHMVKPVNVPELEAVIRRVVSGEASA